MDITSRQSNILTFISEKPGAQTQDILAYINKKNESEISRVTIIRDIEVLLESDFIKKEGSGRSVFYKISPKGSLLAPQADYDEYFRKSPDQRGGVKKTFQSEVFGVMQYLFSKKELLDLKKINEDYLEKKSKLSPMILHKEFERLTIELSWKSSQLEGNTYSLIDTEMLLTQEKEAKGHKKEEAVMLINHKRALDYIHENTKIFKKVSLQDIEDVHSMIIANMGVAKGLRKSLVGITGSVYRPIDNEFQIREAMEKLVETVNELSHPLEKALAFVLLISYIQPFEDGNKRTARLFGNAILLANEYCPLSYRSVDEAEYKKAVLLFYERNSAWLFKQLFVEQFEFAVKNYFQA